MAGSHSDPLAHPEVRQGGALRYIAGFISTVALMGAALIVTMRHDLAYQSYVELVGGLAALALLSQAMLYYGLDISRSQIWKSVSLILTVPLFILTVGLTVWMFQSLDQRTMLMPTTLQQPTLLQ
jgi:cytochrome o ubiquinol oxidase subunit IV